MQSAVAESLQLCTDFQLPSVVGDHEVEAAIGDEPKQIGIFDRSESEIIRMLEVMEGGDLRKDSAKADVEVLVEEDVQATVTFSRREDTEESKSRASRAAFSSTPG